MPTILETLHLEDAAACPGAELAAGLLTTQARIAPKYFYDELGSKLFEAICELDEYYLTRAETALFRDHAAAIAEVVGFGTTMIDLGAGNCAKAATLFPALGPKHYVPVDISAEFLRRAVEPLQVQFPKITMNPLGQDFSDTLVLPKDVEASGRLFFYPGSSLGNFAPLQAAQLLGRIRAACGNSSGLLIGVDLVKDPAVLEAAYDDVLGVTAAFNLNVLRHVNRLLGSNFDPRCWAHVALFNASQSRMEMHLEAKHDALVVWPGGHRQFYAGERIHTENSYKFTKRRVEELLMQSGFGDITCWVAPGDAFLLCHARAV